MYGGQHHYPQEASAWIQQQQQVQQQQSHHQHAQQQAVAAAAAQAHYRSMAANPNHANVLNSVHQDPAAENPNMSEDNRRTMGYIADLLRESSREQALLELSKKREQVPELALILWHSFGTSRTLHHHTRAFLPSQYPANSLSLPLCSRCHDLPRPGDHLRLHPSQPLAAHSRRFQQGLQCPRAAAVCRLP